MNDVGERPSWQSCAQATRRSLLLSIAIMLLSFLTPRSHAQAISYGIDDLAAQLRVVLGPPLRGKLIVSPFAMPCCSLESTGRILAEELTYELATTHEIFVLPHETQSKIGSAMTYLQADLEKEKANATRRILLEVLRYGSNRERSLSLNSRRIEIRDLLICTVTRRDDKPAEERFAVGCNVFDILIGKTRGTAATFLSKAAVERAAQSRPNKLPVAELLQRRWPLRADAQVTAAIHFVQALFAGRGDEAKRALSANARGRVYSELENFAKSVTGRYGKSVDTYPDLVVEEESLRVETRVKDDCGRLRWTSFLIVGAQVLAMGETSPVSCTAGSITATKSDSRRTKDASEQQDDIVQTINTYLKEVASDAIGTASQASDGRAPGLYSFCVPEPVKYCRSAPVQLTHVTAWTRFVGGEVSVRITLNDAGEIEFVKFGHAIKHPDRHDIETFSTVLRDRAKTVATNISEAQKQLPSYVEIGGGTITPIRDAASSITAARSALTRIADLDHGRPLASAVTAFLTSHAELPESRNWKVRNSTGQIDSVEGIERTVVAGMLTDLANYARTMFAAPDVAPTIHVASTPAGALFSILDEGDPSFTRAPLQTDGSIKYIWLGQYLGTVQKEGFLPATIKINLVDDPRNHIKCELVRANPAATSKCWMTDR